MVYGWALRVWEDHRGVPFSSTKGSVRAQVAGKSMEPTTPDGTWCLFSSRLGDTPEKDCPPPAPTHN